MADAVMTEADMRSAEPRFLETHSTASTTAGLGARPANLIEKAVLPLSEGTAVLEAPKELSPESFEDLEAWLQILLRKAKRSIRRPGT